MKKSSVYYLLLGAIVILYLIISISLSEKEIDWSFSFSGKDKSPYGSFVLNEELKSFFPEADIISTEERVYNTLMLDTIPYYGKHCTYFLLNHDLSLDEFDLDELLYFVSLGNDAFLAGYQIPVELLDTLGLQIDYPYLSFHGDFHIDSLSHEDTANSRFLNPHLPQHRGYYFNTYTMGYSLSIDEEAETDLYPIAISVNNQDSVNMVKVKVNEGQIFLCTSPLSFTNYHMLTGPNLEFVETALSHLNKETDILIWDEYYKAKNMSRIEEQSSPLRYVLSQDGLRWAFWITIFMALLFGIFEAKRKQRIVPVIPPLPNSTMDFTETIGRLYYQNSTHKELCDKKIKLWLSYVNHKYGIEISDLDDEFIRIVSGKTGIPSSIIKDLVYLIQKVQRQTSISENEFTELNNGLNNFYQEISV